MKVLDAALIYLNHYKFSVVPLNPIKSKGTYIKWKPFQERLPTEKEVKYWFTLYDDAMIAVVTGKVSNLCCVDLDLYKMTTAEKEEIVSIFPDTMTIPTIKTPRGGQHFLFNYQDADGLKTCSGLIKHVDFQGEGGITIMPPSANGNGSYSWAEGLTLKESPLLPLPIYIKNKIINNNNTAFNSDKNLAKPYETLNTLTNLNLFCEEGLRDQTFFHAANCMIRGGLEPSLCFEVLETVLEKANLNSKEKYTPTEIKTKIQSALNRFEQRKRNLKREIIEWVTLIDLNFSLKDLKTDLKLLNAKDCNILYVTINELSKQGLIEKEGKIPGIYRKCIGGVKFIDISEIEDLTFLNLKWPLQVEDYVKTSPKSVSIIAGDTDAGKSAFLANFAHLNLESQKMLYFSSEMTGERFKDRIKNLSRPVRDWKKLLFTNDKSGDFHDSIDPDAINIIDYLELDPGRVFDVATYIKKIFDKLNNGVAIIALQKKRGESMAYGRDWTMQKSEFYMTLSVVDGDHICKIEKAKNWAVKRANPVGMKKKFYLIDGVTFAPNPMRPDWHKGDGNKPEDYGKEDF